ncbi:hypothetical protein HBA55_33000 [Pseudomaricurvus alkylphenolicus]|uniref:nuclear transport factor 2 family protein n=1 Tax=Pseudomaricurvus alkylphenolicus TaxID=1306991 RepID=UPI00141FC230|nr:nuclear transport factor 2 family protein [Pseudomaricurvus alkylphenolicus]NIB44453.1 hypothetical protein [Pseudomaricurvus alkylphenolicus]
MKSTTNQLRPFIFLLLFSIIGVEVTAENSDTEAAAGIVKVFLEAAPRNDTDAIRTVVSDQFRVFVTNTKGKASRTISKNRYLELMDAKIIGGRQWDYEIIAVDVSINQLAYVKAKIEQASPKETLYVHFTVAKVGNLWKIVQESVHRVIHA